MADGRAWVRAAVTLVAVFLALAFALPADRVAPWRILAAGGLVTGLAGLRRRQGTPVRPEHPPPSTAVDGGPPAEQVVRLARLEAALGFALESHRQFDRSIRPLLCRLVDERLRANQGVVLTERPAAARALIGEELWQLVEDERAARTHPGRGPDPGRLQRLVTQVRAI